MKESCLERANILFGWSLDMFIKTVQKWHMRFCFHIFPLFVKIVVAIQLNKLLVDHYHNKLVKQYIHHFKSDDKCMVNYKTLLKNVKHLTSNKTAAWGNNLKCCFKIHCFSHRQISSNIDFGWLSEKTTQILSNNAGTVEEHLIILSKVSTKLFFLGPNFHNLFSWLLNIFVMHIDECKI